MKKIFLSALCSLSILSADVVLSEKLIEEDIDQDQYQLFITNTKSTSTKGLACTLIYQGNLYKKMGEKDSYYPKDVEDAIQNVEKNIIFKNWFHDVNLYSEIDYDFSVKKFDFKHYENLEEILQTTEYRNKEGQLVTTIHKLLQGEDSFFAIGTFHLKDDYKTIFDSSNDTSYQYHKGLISIMYSTKRELEAALSAKKLSNEGNFNNEAY